MFIYKRFKPQHFLEFLNQGLFDDEINEVIKFFPLYEPKLQFELVHYLRKNPSLSVSLTTFSKALNISQKDAKVILTAPAKTSKIVLTSEENEGKVIKALVIPGTSKVITNNEHIKKDLSLIKRFIKKGFAVFFEETFSGKSFMLPIAVSLYINNLPSDLVFTGRLNSKGEIFDVEHIEEKFRVAKKENLRLVTPSQVKNIKVIKAFLDRDRWNIPFYVTSESLEEMKHFLEFFPEKFVEREFELFKGLELFYDLTKEKFCLVTGQLKDKKDWETACNEFYTRIQLVKNKLPGSKVFHFGIRGPASLAFAFGTLWGAQDQFIVYHYQTGKYHPISVEDPKHLKEKLKNIEDLDWIFEKKGDDLVIILKLSHHELLADVKSYVKSYLKTPSFLFIEHRKSGNLLIEDFKKVVQEIASLIQDIRRNHSFKSFHFFFSCPVAIAFMLGVTFGHYVSGYIYNYQQNEQTYSPVINFSTLKNLRERAF
ncbi:MAG: SAVED domain-containing protein [Thermodesulfobacteria bacterium]|nr:SAVED domain-containing protein [Thermodesulfobacteriota bacterium]